MPARPLARRLALASLGAALARGATPSAKGASAVAASPSPPATVSVCLLVMARDEEALLRRHLGTWLPLLEGGGGCLVGQVDERSTDGSHRAFFDPEVLPEDRLPHDRRYVYHYTFDGLGPARTLLLGEAWHKFGSSATHFFIADPDWRFDLGPSATVVRERGLQPLGTSTPLAPCEVERLCNGPPPPFFFSSSPANNYLFSTTMGGVGRGFRCGRKWRA